MFLCLACYLGDGRLHYELRQYLQLWTVVANTQDTSTHYRRIVLHHRHIVDHGVPTDCFLRIGD